MSLCCTVSENNIHIYRWRVLARCSHWIMWRVSAALPCMLGTSLLQTAGGRLHSSSHKRDKTLPKTHRNTKIRQSGIYLPRIMSHKHTEVGMFTFNTSFILQNFIHHLFWQENTGDVKIGKVSRFPRDINYVLYTTQPNITNKNNST